MMYTVFPQRGGLVERCHAAAENTHSALGLFMKGINRTFASRLSHTHTRTHAPKSCCNSEKKKIDETMCFTNYWL